MKRILLLPFLLPVLLLLSIAPEPTKVVLAPAVVKVPVLASVVVPAARGAVHLSPAAAGDKGKLQQGCTFQNAPSRASEQIYDGDRPFGEIAAWSCTGYAAMQAELERNRALINQDIAAWHAYRDACRAKPVEEQHGCPWPVQQ